ncbi:helix-turn-helix domain-containing protein [Singulisphaera rosea]
MPTYSQDLRRRVIETVRNGEGSTRQIAHRFCVSPSFVTRLLRHHRETGSVEPKPHGGGRRPALGSAELERLRQLSREQPAATLEELRRQLGVECSIMAISRGLRKLQARDHSRSEVLPQGERGPLEAKRRERSLH